MKTWLLSFYSGLYFLINIATTFLAYMVVLRWLIIWLSYQFLFDQILVNITAPVLDFLSKITGLPKDLQYDVYRPGLMALLLFGLKILVVRFSRLNDRTNSEV